MYIFHTAKTYPRAFLKPFSKFFMQSGRARFFQEKCNCFFCNIINNNNKKQTRAFTRRALRDA